MKTVNLHLISDSTGETVNTVARASMVQFEGVVANPQIWNLVRSRRRVQEILRSIEEKPGFVLYTLAEASLRKELENGCNELQVPCINVLDPVVAALAAYIGAEVQARPGRQHIMNAEYFNRIEAIHFVLAHDDGQSVHSLNESDVILVGVSRTSKTPICIYLANRGIKAANVPFVPGCPLPQQLFAADMPLIVGLTKDPIQLVDIRKNRLRMLNQDQLTDYVDAETVTQEVGAARRLFTRHNWPVIDVTRRSIEEAAASIIQMLHRWQEDVE